MDTENVIVERLTGGLRQARAHVNWRAESLQQQRRKEVLVASYICDMTQRQNAIHTYFICRNVKIRHFWRQVIDRQSRLGDRQRYTRPMWSSEPEGQPRTSLKNWTQLLKTESACEWRQVINLHSGLGNRQFSKLARSPERTDLFENISASAKCTHCMF